MQWIKATDRLPDLYPVNDSNKKHYRLDGEKVDGLFLDSQCFEYFDFDAKEYNKIKGHEFYRIEWLDETPPVKEQGYSGWVSIEENGKPNYGVNLWFFDRRFKKAIAGTLLSIDGFKRQDMFVSTDGGHYPLEKVTHYIYNPLPFPPQNTIK